MLTLYHYFDVLGMSVLVDDVFQNGATTQMAYVFCVNLTFMSSIMQFLSLVKLLSMLSYVLLVALRQRFLVCIVILFPLFGNMFFVI